MKYLIQSILLLTISLAFSQNDIPTGNISDGYKIIRGEAKGTPFLFDNWYVGYGIYNGGGKSEPQLMNYDIHQNNVVYKTSESSNNIMILQDTSFKGIILKNEANEILLSKIPGYDFEKSKKDEKYYEIASPPSNSVIIEYNKKLDDPNASGWTSSTNNSYNAEYKFKMNYYVLNRNNKYEEVKLKNKSLIKTFKDKKDKIEKYIEDNNIDIESPADMVPVVEYYHTL